MTRPTPELATALRATAARLATGARYAWGHHGRCNCGHLAQTVTGRDAEALHAAALERARAQRALDREAGDWGELVLEHCPTTGLPLEDAIDALLALGLTRRDLANLEDLADRAVLARLPLEARRRLRRNRREDVVRYLEAWAGLVEEQLPAPTPARRRRALVAL